MSCTPLKFSSSILCLMLCVTSLNILMLSNMSMVEPYMIVDILQENALWFSNCDFMVINNILKFSMKIRSCWGQCQLSHWSPTAEDLKKCLRQNLWRYEELLKIFCTFNPLVTLVGPTGDFLHQWTIST